MDLATEIVQRISQGEWTASKVLEAYLTRAVLAQDTTNCLTEGSYKFLWVQSQQAWLKSVVLVFFSQARAEAQALDEEFALTGKIRGPLHGVPVSFKDICSPFLPDLKMRSATDMCFHSGCGQLMLRAMIPRWATHPTPTSPRRRTRT